MRYFRPPPADDGRGVSLYPHPTPYNLTGTEPILNPKTTFDSPGHEPSDHIAKFYLNVTDDVTCRVKGQIFDYLSLLESPGKAAV